MPLVYFGSCEPMVLLPERACMRRAGQQIQRVDRLDAILSQRLQPKEAALGLAMRRPAFRLARKTPLKLDSLFG